LLEHVNSPEDVKKLSREQAVQLAQEIREYLVHSVSKTGGHLGPNLGVVELSIAMHRVFNSPKDTFIFDTGHQSYVHKLLTGRTDFTDLRKKGGRRKLARVDRDLVGGWNRQGQRASGSG
jgi:1-deoxy-D-xylulose-5-phosphate synthase